MDPVKNIRLLTEACAALGIAVDVVDSAHDLYAKVICQRKTQTIPTPPPLARLDEMTYKTRELKRLVALLGRQDRERLDNEVEQRWLLVRNTTLGNHDGVVYVERDTSGGELELIQQFKESNFMLIITEVKGLHFAHSHSAPSCPSRFKRPRTAVRSSSDDNFGL